MAESLLILTIAMEGYATALMNRTVSTIFPNCANPPTPISAKYEIATSWELALMNGVWKLIRKLTDAKIQLRDNGTSVGLHVSLHLLVLLRLRYRCVDGFAMSLH